MEHENTCHADLEPHPDEESKDEVSKALKENEEFSHVPLRHQSSVNRSEETGFALNRNSDSPALESVCRYAKKIRFFLGWEKGTQDFGLEEKSSADESPNETILFKGLCSSNSEIPDKRSSHCSDSDNEGIIRENAIGDKNFCDPDTEICQNKNPLLETGTNSDRQDDSKCGEILFINQNESNLDVEKEGLASKSNYQSQTFRSEVNIFIADCRNDDRKGIAKMNVSLVQDQKTIEEGLVLNDADSIFQNESGVISSETRKNTELGDNLPKEVNESGTVDETKITKYDKTPDKRFESENTLDETNLLNEDTYKPLAYVKKFTLEEENYTNDSVQKPEEEIINNEIKQNNIKDESLVKCSELHEYKFGENNGLEHLKESLPVEKEKHFVIHSAKENQGNNCTKPYIDGTLKASVHYEKEKRKLPFTSVEKQGLGRKESLYSDDDTVCGLGFCRPRWLQSFATPKMYVILYSIIGILHGSYYSYLIGTISTLEKRFAFKTKISGAIMIADEITPLLLGVIIGYYAGKGHRPRIIAFGMLLSAGCCFCSSLPYFIYGPVQHLILQSVQNHTGPEYCDISIGKESCDLDERPPTLPAVLFLVMGSFLKGFGNLAYYAIGLAYLDDNSAKKSTPIYLAIALALRLLGPLVGFLMSSAFLKIYENPFDDPGFGPEDPRWIGAWWIGFFLQGILLVIFTLPIALFPRRLPNHKNVEKVAPKENSESVKETFRGLVSALKRLGKNPIFILLIINTTMKIFGHFGHSIMLPKYMENQFRLSASDASLFSGATSITCIMLSTILGGFLIWKFRPRIKLLLAGMITSEIILCIGFLVLMIPRCQPADMLHFGRDSNGLILNSVCNQNCDCSTTSFTPFCGPDGITTYFSPCYAGCTEELMPLVSTKVHKEFGNCSCVNVVESSEPVVAKITEGFCPDDNCWSQTLAYLIILFILLTISNTLTVAHTMILLRSVHPSDKSVALGTFETFICLFGFIPFPVTFGALVDSACLVWEESCGETGNCWFYDMEKYSYLLHGASALFCSLSTICLITMYFLSPRVRNLYVEEEDDGEYIDSIKLDTVSGSVTKL